MKYTRTNFCMWLSKAVAEEQNAWSGSWQFRMNLWHWHIHNGTLSPHGSSLFSICEVWSKTTVDKGINEWITSSYSYNQADILQHGLCLFSKCEVWSKTAVDKGVDEWITSSHSYNQGDMLQHGEFIFQKRDVIKIHGGQKRQWINSFIPFLQSSWHASTRWIYFSNASCDQKPRWIKRLRWMNKFIPFLKSRWQISTRWVYFPNARCDQKPRWIKPSMNE